MLKWWYFDTAECNGLVLTLGNLQGAYQLISHHLNPCSPRPGLNVLTGRDNICLPSWPTGQVSHSTLMVDSCEWTHKGMGDQTRGHPMMPHTMDWCPATIQHLAPAGTLFWPTWKGREWQEAVRGWLGSSEQPAGSVASKNLFTPPSCSLTGTQVDNCEVTKQTVSLSPGVYTNGTSSLHLQGIWHGQGLLGVAVWNSIHHLNVP